MQVETQKDNNFSTSDIGLVTWLRSSGVPLLQIIPLGQYYSTFVFAKPSQDLLDQWLRGSASASVRVVIAEYRHTIRESREAWRLSQEQGVQ